MRTPKEILLSAKAKHEAGNLAEAEEEYDKLLGYTDSFDPNLACCYGALLSRTERFGLAAHLLRQAVAQCPDFGSAWTNLGITLFHLGRDEAAEFCYQRALELMPGDVATLSSYSGLYVNRANPQKVIDLASQALKVDPECPDAHNHMALGLLESGRYDEAWPHYEYRWNLPDRIKDRRPFKAPKWTGERVGTLAIHGEQGIGDEILFMSVMDRAKRRADKVIVECAPRLVNLFKNSFHVPCYGTHAELIAAEGEPDAYIPMASLFGLLGLPEGKSYLSASRQFVPKRIGIAWRGGSRKTNKRERTIKLDHLAPILKTPGYEFVSVQYSDGPEAIEAEKHGLKCLVTSRNVDECAEAISSCERIITVCQTAVHLAGAMGVPCWVLTPKKCAWRYCSPNDRVPWYESVRLFRQGDDERWEPVIERIANALR